MAVWVKEMTWMRNNGFVGVKIEVTDSFSDDRARSIGGMDYEVKVEAINFMYSRYCEKGKIQETLDFIEQEFKTEVKTELTELGFVKIRA